MNRYKIAALIVAGGLLATLLQAGYKEHNRIIKEGAFNLGYDTCQDINDISASAIKAVNCVLCQ